MVSIPDKPLTLAQQRMAARSKLDPIEELVKLYKVIKQGTQFIVPDLTNEECEARWRELGIPAKPTFEQMHQACRRFWDRWPATLEHLRKKHGLWTPPEAAEKRVSVPAATTIPGVPARKPETREKAAKTPSSKAGGSIAPKGAAEGEARVRSMKTPDLIEACRKNKIKTEVHPTNAGLNSMRMRNALYAFLRGGGSLK